MLPKNKTRNLKNSCRAMLKKRKFLKGFGSLMALSVLVNFSLVDSAFAATNPKGTTINGGMQASSQDLILNNYGSILNGLKIEHVNSQGSQRIVTYTGMLGSSNASASYNFSNFGDITIHNASADAVVGMLADAAVSGSHVLNNSGTINVSGGDNVFGMSATVAGTGSQSLVNSGTINASGKNNVQGMFVTASGGNNSLINSNNITVRGVGTLSGIYAIGDANHNLENSGIISVNGSGAELYGMSTKGSGNHTLNNSNIITATGGTGDNVYGMSAEGTGIHKLNNSSTITVKSQANKVHGIHAQSSLDFAQGSHEVNNSGTINVSGVDSIYGIYGEVKSGNLNVHNSGTINASGTNLVYGIYIAQVQGGNASHNVTNTGYVSAKASNGIAYEVYGTTNYSVNTFATNLRNWSVNDAVFGVIDTQAITFNNSKLILRPGTAEQGFAYGKEFKVADMISLINQSSMAIPSTATFINGTIAEVTTEVPFLTAKLSNGNDPYNASVRIDTNVNEETVPGAISMQQAVTIAQTQFNYISSALRSGIIKGYTGLTLASQNNAQGINAGSDIITPKKLEIFLTPYISHVNNSKLDYNGNSYGVFGGINYRLSEKFSFGGHLNYSASDLSADIMSMDTDSSSFALGLHAAYNFTPEWYLRGQVTGSIQESESDYKSSELASNSDFTGHAFYAALATGYVWEIADNHSLSPEIGISYLNTKTNSYDIKFANSAYNMSYDDNSYNAIYATFNLDWRSEWALEKGNLALTAGLGLNQKLSSNDIETGVRMLGTSFTTSYTKDSTAFLANTGIEYQKGNFAISVNYNGEYGSVQQVHTGSLNLKLMF